jgi:curved DNA-binding protein CbpA
MAYKRKALLLHPDKNIGKTQDEIQKNTETFQRLTSYYEILIDPAKRERYDRTGSIQPETLLKDQDVTWSEYFDCLFQKVT